MQFQSELIPAKFIERRKRFFADITLADGSAATAHCPNPGSMRGNLKAGMRVYIEDKGADHASQGRKLRYRWVLADTGEHLVCIDTAIANPLVHETLAQNRIAELQGYAEIIPEFTIGESRLDFLLQGHAQLPPCFVEVKSVSMIEDGIALFPDSVTRRGQKHLVDLMELAQQGYRAVLLFVVQAAEVESFAPAEAIDPEYARLLRLAAGFGVEILAYGIAPGLKEIRWQNRCRVDLQTGLGRGFHE